MRRRSNRGCNSTEQYTVAERVDLCDPEIPSCKYPKLSEKMRITTQKVVPCFTKTKSKIDTQKIISRW